MADYLNNANYEKFLEEVLKYKHPYEYSLLKTNMLDNMKMRPYIPIKENYDTPYKIDSNILARAHRVDKIYNSYLSDKVRKRRNYGR